MTVLTLGEIDEDYPYVLSEPVVREVLRLVRTASEMEGASTEISSWKAPRKRSILELQGMGKEVWQGVDAVQYIRELRSEWDARESTGR